MSTIDELLGTRNGAQLDVRAAYDHVRPSRFMRQRRDIPTYGATADYHFATDEDFLRSIELARDAYRNDAIVRPMINTAVLNIINGGFMPDPDTGDTALDYDLYERFTAWAEDPEACEVTGQLTWLDIQTLALRAMFVDGDVFVLPTDGKLQLVEAHRCRTPGVGGNGATIHGVELDGLRRRVRYWFCRDEIGTEYTRLPASRFVSVQAYVDGEPQVFHVIDHDRVSQTRGVTVLHNVFKYLSIFEDINIAKLVQQQMASCFAILKERGPGAPPLAAGAQQFGTRTTSARSDGSMHVIEGIAPGMMVEGGINETLKGFSPNIPNPEYFEHAKLTLQIIGLSIGLPIVMTLMDASETNFSGWRGAVDQARRGFLARQQTLRTRLHDRVWRWKVREWARSDPAIRAALERLGQRMLRCRWNTPRWPYIQPLQDAQADALRAEKRLTSPRRLHAERGQDVDEIVAETIADNARTIRAAIAEAQAIAAETGIAVDPMRLLHLETTLSMGPRVAADGAAAEPLNGAQVTAAIDVVAKLRDGIVSPVAAAELLRGIGIEPERAQAIVAATPQRDPDAAADEAFRRELVKALLADPTVNDVVANATDIARMLAELRVPMRAGYTPPLLPIVAADGPRVTGDAATNAAGEIIGGTTQPRQPETESGEKGTGADEALGAALAAETAEPQPDQAPMGDGAFDGSAAAATGDEAVETEGDNGE